MTSRNEITLYNGVYVDKIYFDIDTRFTGKPHLNERAKTAIRNAWEASAVICINTGQLWIDQAYLPQILRTTEDVAKVFIEDLDRRYKKSFIVNNTYTLECVYGSEVLCFLDKRLQRAFGSKRDYLCISSQYYQSVRDSDQAVNIATSYYEKVQKDIRNLKNNRIRLFNISYDELTGQILDQRTCQFSHIRSVALYPEYSIFVENGLIINAATHEIITRSGVQNEESLYDLCDSQGWSTSWYNTYSDWLDDNEGL
jgi:hypothetical protein